MVASEYYFWLIRPSGPVQRYPHSLNPQLFLSGFYFCPHASGESGSECRYFWIRSLAEWKNVNRNEYDNVWAANPDIFESDDVAKSCPVCYGTINQYGGSTCTPAFSKVNLDTIGWVWTGEFDLMTLRVDGEIFESGNKIFGFKNIWIRVDGTSVVGNYVFQRTWQI